MAFTNVLETVLFFTKLEKNGVKYYYTICKFANSRVILFTCVVYYSGVACAFLGVVAAAEHLGDK